MIEPNNIRYSTKKYAEGDNYPNTTVSFSTILLGSEEELVNKMNRLLKVAKKSSEQQ